jgi:serine/threonine protein kinase/Tfp pilus assembly protein PilF
MSLSHSSSIWDDTSVAGIDALVERYRADWKSSPEFRPDPKAYLPEAPDDRRAALAALLRDDLNLRRGAGERSPIESYLDRFPELDDELLVVLIYEEYCLREEAGEAPDAAEYEARFPRLAGSFQEVMAIHELVRRAPGSLSLGSRAGSVPLPEAGETIAGYRLVEQLGRGAFARVYLAEEQHLADRPVALKVTRTGSREPQTLARLQHTHIVPVYSYRTDPATGLHLLCMPYLGRITLLQVLCDPEIKSLGSGADLLKLLDRMQPPESSRIAPAATRMALEGLTYPRAIAWWGARMAQALQHAHDRGVLHRDIKPSNVLVTAEGLPMLLDFNLAQEPRAGDANPLAAGVGGTLAYMAPEHLEALARGSAEAVDKRSDIYALGLVLFDCLVRGSRPFALPSRSISMNAALLRAAEARRGGPPRLRVDYPEVPAALEAVVQRCLAPDPSDRYTSAEELAVDLQAVADDSLLRFAREPLPGRLIHWLRWNRRRIALAMLLMLAMGAGSYGLIKTRLDALLLESEVNRRVDEARQSVDAGQIEVAVSQLDTAARLAQDHWTLRSLHREIVEESHRVSRIKEIRNKADRVFDIGERLRFSLLHFSADRKDVSRSVEVALAEFSIPDDPDWMRRPDLSLLDATQRQALINQANELLFLWVVVALDREGSVDRAEIRRAATICDAAVAFATPVEPWEELRHRCEAALGGNPPGLSRALPSNETSARACFQRALICDLDGRAQDAVAWLERATMLEPEDYWSQFYLGFYLGREGQNGRALEHYQAAVALRPDSPWARMNRALLYQARGDWALAIDDLNRALESPQGSGLLKARFDLGFVKQILGDDAGARAAYELVIAQDKQGPLARAGRLNCAKLDIDAGAVDRGRAEYDALLSEDPRDAPARLSRALLALRSGQPGLAESDLSIVLHELPERADEILARRAIARLATGRLEGAEDDAAGAYRRKPTPSRERLWVRTLLALGRVEDLSWLDQPDDLPPIRAGGRWLEDDLRAAVKRLETAAAHSRQSMASARIHRTRAVLLSALGDPSADAEASQSIALAPEWAEAYLVRARVRRRAGRRSDAIRDIEEGLALNPGDPRLMEFSGLLKAETGNPSAGLIDLDRAVVRGARGTVRIPRARALMALGQYESAVREWSLAVEGDPDDPQAYLGRAQAFLRQGLRDRALVDLEQAADRATNRPGMMARIALTYARCLGASPERIPRAIALARRTFSTWIATLRSSRLE